MANRKKAMTEFGQYLVDEIEKTDLNQSDFIEEVQMARPYFYNILTGTPPSQDVLEKIFVVLNKHLPADEKRRGVLFDKAAKCRGEIPADINDLIKEHPDEWDSIRAALTKMLSAHV